VISIASASLVMVRAIAKVAVLGQSTVSQYDHRCNREKPAKLSGTCTIAQDACRYVPQLKTLVNTDRS
jgi:hypothetical protein